MTSVSSVVLLIADGLRPDAVTPTLMPALHALAASGWRARGQTVTPSVTVAALVSLATGVSPATHGLVSPRIPAFGTLRGLRPLPAELKRHGRATAVVTSALPTGHRLIARTLLGLGGVGTLVSGGSTPVEVAESAQRFLDRSRAAFTTVYLNDCDVAGHRDGWMSAPYLDAARRIDDAVDVLAPLASRPGTVLIVTADHGGGGVRANDHDEPHPVNSAVPVIVAGSAVRAAESRAEPSLLDVPATVLHLLGVAVPPGYQGRPLPLKLEDAVVAA